MSFYTKKGKSWVRPTVWLKDGILYAETAILVQILSLFSYCRRVKVYRKGRFIKIETRWLWFLTAQKFITFSRIRRIETEFSTTPLNIGNISWTDRYDEFSIFLRLQDPYEYCWLISFGGESVVLTHWQGVLLDFLDVLLGNYPLIDKQGDQEITFQNYYTLLKQFVEPHWTQDVE
ncbi:MAG: hypothetical protein HC877_13400 [Thioploca sp.]|nr:hypothetical protein [Thioploca sp.]